MRIFFLVLLIGYFTFLGKYSFTNILEDKSFSKKKDKITVLQLKYLLGQQEDNCKWVSVEEYIDDEWRIDEVVSSNFFLLQSFSEIATFSLDQEEVESYREKALQQIECFELNKEYADIRLSDPVVTKYGSPDSTRSLYWGSWLYSISKYLSLGVETPKYIPQIVETLGDLSVDSKNPRPELRKVQGLASWSYLDNNPKLLSKAEEIYTDIEVNYSTSENYMGSFYTVPQLLKTACVLKKSGSLSQDISIMRWLNETQEVKLKLKDRLDEALIWYQVIVAADACLQVINDADMHLEVMSLLIEAIENELRFFDQDNGGIIEFDSSGNKRKTISLNAELARILFKLENFAYK